MFDLQSLVDDLAERIGRSVVVGDTHHRQIAVSAQLGEVDRIRVDEVLTRRTDPAVAAFMASLRLASLVEPLRIPANPELESLPRLCAPLRTEGRLLGFLWIIEAPPLSADELRLVDASAAQIRDAFASSLGRVNANLRSSIDLTRALLGDGRQQALADAGRSGLLLSIGQVEVWSFIVAGDAEANGDPTTADLTELLADAHLITRAGGFIGMPFEHRLSAVTRALPDGGEPFALNRAVERSCARKGWRLVSAGKSRLASGEDPREVHEQAIFAASVARWEGDPVRDWHDLGAWTLLAGEAIDERHVKTLSRGAYALINRRQASHWQTLLAYLDCGGDAARTCEALHIQRATLYYRLNRVKEIAGDGVLTDGWERTSAHVALRLWRACANGAV